MQSPSPPRTFCYLCALAVFLSVKARDYTAIGRSRILKGAGGLGEAISTESMAAVPWSQHFPLHLTIRAGWTVLWEQQIRAFIYLFQSLNRERISNPHLPILGTLSCPLHDQWHLLLLTFPPLPISKDTYAPGHRRGDPPAGATTDIPAAFAPLQLLQATDLGQGQWRWERSSSLCLLSGWQGTCR